MNNEQIYSIVGQGLDIATQKGVFNLSDAKVIEIDAEITNPLVDYSSITISIRE